MRKGLAVVAFALILVGCVAPPPRRTTYRGKRQAPAPVQCVSHPGLNYSPVLVKVNVNFSYTLRHPEEAREWTPSTFFESLQASNPGKYRLADGVVPNLILTVNVTNDGQDHFGASVDGAGNGEGHLFYYSWPQNYVTGTKLLSDVASQVNGFVVSGWNNGHCGY